MLYIHMYKHTQGHHLHHSLLHSRMLIKSMSPFWNKLFNFTYLHSNISAKKTFISNYTHIYGNMYVVIRWYPHQFIHEIKSRFCSCNCIDTQKGKYWKNLYLHIHKWTSKNLLYVYIETTLAHKPQHVF